MNGEDFLFDHFYLLLAAVVAGLIVILLLRILAETLFGLQHLDFVRLEPEKAIEIADNPELRQVVLIDYSWTELEQLRTHFDHAGKAYEFFDLSLEREALEKRSWKTEPKRWLIVGLESILMNQCLRHGCLEMLEHLSSKPDVEIFFFSEVSPMARLRQAREREKLDLRTRKGEGEGAGGASQAARESFRWSNLFADFTTFYGVPPPRPTTGPWGNPKDFVDEILNDEFAQIRSSKVQAQRLAARRDARKARTRVSREAVIAYLANFLGDYYQRQWLKSTAEEHLAMHHLAHGRYINADNFVVLDNLLLRGLVRRGPDFRLMNESFAYWIRMLNQPDWFEDFRVNAERGGTWQFMRVPLLLAIVSSVTLLAYLDRGGSGSLLTLLPAIAAGIPLLLTQFSQARQNIPG